MQFRRLGLKNWKNFQDVTVSIGQRLFLVGPNASGKSNFLDALRFLRDLASSGGGLQSAVARRGGVSLIRCLAARRFPDVEVETEVEGDDGTRWQYRLSFYQSKEEGEQARVRSEEVRRAGRGEDWQVLLRRPSEEDQGDPLRLTQTHLEQVNVNRAFRELARFFSSIRYLHLVPQLVRETDRSVGRTNDPFGGDFLEQVAKTPKRERERRLGRIQAALQVAVPQLDAMELWRDSRGTPHLRGKYRHWRPRGAWQTEEQFSDGTLRLLGLLWAAMDRGGPLLLEEPELSLHAEIVRRIPQMFYRLTRKTRRQILLSTHSLDLVSDEGIGLKEVVLLRPSEDGTEVIPASSIEEVRDLLERGVPLGEVVTAYTRPASVEQLPLLFEVR